MFSTLKFRPSNPRTGYFIVVAPELVPWMTAVSRSVTSPERERNVDASTGIGTVAHHKRIIFLAERWR
jgi:hypothetical protein